MPGQNSHPSAGQDVHRLKGSGVIKFPIEQFSEFAAEQVGSERQSPEPVWVRGLPWYIRARVGTSSVRQNAKWLGFHLVCDVLGAANAGFDNPGLADDDDACGGWNCFVCAKLKILTHEPAEMDDLEKELQAEFFEIKNSAGIDHLITFDELLNPDNFWCHDDTVTLIAELEVDPPLNLAKLPRPDSVLVNGVRVRVNRELLASQSDFFRSLFFDDRFSNSDQISIDADVDDFRRLMGVMCPPIWPEHRPLDDDCVEGVLQLANQFQISAVEAACAHFLRTESKRKAAFKLRLATKFGLGALKTYVLSILKLNDFLDEDFLDEHIKMDEDANRALKRRLREVQRSRSASPPPAATPPKRVRLSLQGQADASSSSASTSSAEAFIPGGGWRLNRLTLSGPGPVLYHPSYRSQIFNPANRTSNR